MSVTIFTVFGICVLEVSRRFCFYFEEFYFVFCVEMSAWSHLVFRWRPLLECSTWLSWFSGGDYRWNAVPGSLGFQVETTAGMQYLALLVFRWRLPLECSTWLSWFSGGDYHWNAVPGSLGFQVE